MEIGTVQTLISTLGFPIVCVLFLGWFIFKSWTNQQDQNKSREDKLYEYLGKAQVVNEELTKTNSEFLSVLSNYKEDLDDIKEDVKIIKEKVGK